MRDLVFTILRSMSTLYTQYIVVGDENHAKDRYPVAFAGIVEVY